MTRTSRVLCFLLMAAHIATAQELEWEHFSVDDEIQKITEFSDWNGDGTIDFLAFGVFDVSQSTQADIRILSGADGSTLYEWSFGGVIYNIAYCGDVDGDGAPDFAVAVDCCQPQLSIRIEIRSPAHSNVIWSDTGSWHAFYGWQAMAGDFDGDGDGRPDFATCTARSNQSDVYAYDHLGQPRFTLSMTAAGFMVQTLEGIGDVDGDGGDDLAIGLLHLTNTLGAVRVVSGRTGQMIYQVTGTTPFEELGGRIAATGDLDNDGVADFFASSHPFAAIKKVRALSGATGATLFEWDHAADSLVSADFDLDGIHDVFAGSNAIVFMQPRISGRNVVLSGRDGGELWRFEGDAASQGVARYAALIGPTPGNPHPAIAWLDAAYTTPAGPGLGRIRVMRGVRKGSLFTGRACSSSPAIPTIAVRQMPTNARIAVSKAPASSLVMLVLAPASTTAHAGWTTPAPRRAAWERTRRSRSS